MNIGFACPAPASLQDYLLGRMPEGTAIAVEEHLSSCPGCRKLLPTIPAEDDFVADFRAQARRPRPKNALLDRLAGDLRGLLDGLPPGRHAASPNYADATPAPNRPTAKAEEDVLSLLAPPQQPDEMGRLGDYRVLKVLGSGGMGVVFLAEDVRLRRRVALKAMKPGLAANSEARQRFLREAQLTASLTHDHIIAVHQVGEEKGVPFLAMPLLQGESLDDRLKREGRLQLAEALRICREAAEGLAAAHEHGLIHRDVKPANLWMETLPGGRSRVKILDFGLARAGGGDAAQITQSGMILGTPAYMAPEQAGGRVDHRADLFSLGCVLYRMTTGQLPFQGKDVLEILKMIATYPPCLPRQVNPDIPQPLSDLMVRLLEKEPARRPQSAREVIRALDEIGLVAPAQKSSGPALTVGDGKTAATRVPAVRNLAALPKRMVLWTAGTAAALLVGVFAVAAAVLVGSGLGAGAQDKTPDNRVPLIDGKQPSPPISSGSLITSPSVVKGVTNWDIQADTYSPVYRLENVMRGRKLWLYEFGVVMTLDPAGFDLQPLFDQAFSAPAPDGKFGARVDGTTVQIWEESGKAPRLKLQHTSSVRKVRWSPDGATIACCTAGGLYLWNLDTGRPKWIFKRDCVDVVWKTDGKQLLVYEVGEAATWKLYVVNADSGEELSRNSGVGGDLRLSDGSDLAAVTGPSSTGGVSVAILAGNPPKQVGEFKDPKHAASTAAVCSPDGKWAAYGTGDGVVHVFGVEKSDIGHELRGHENAILALTFSPDSKTLISSGQDRTIRFWDVETGKYRGALLFLSGDHAAPPIPWAAVSPEGYYRASPKAEEKLSFLVKPEGEKARNISPAEFAQKYGWKNDPSKVNLMGK